MRRMLLLIALLPGLLAVGPAAAQVVAPPATAVAAAPSPEQLRDLAELLRDPDIQAWLQAQAEAGAPATAAPAAAEPSMMMMHQAMAGRLDAMRGFLRELVAAGPRLPDELGRALTRARDRAPRARRPSGDRPAGRLRGARLRARVAVLVGERRAARAPDRGRARHARASACARSGCAPPTAWACCWRSRSAASAPSCCSTGRRCSSRSCSPICSSS